MKKDENLNSKLDEIIDENKQDSPAFGPLSVYTAAGVALGLLIGTAMDNIAPGLCIGTGAALLLYCLPMVFRSVKNKKRKDSDCEENK